MVTNIRQANPEGGITLGADKDCDAAEFIQAERHEGHAAGAAEQVKPRLCCALADCSQPGLQHLAAKAQTYRAGLWLGQSHRPDPSGDGARHREGRPGLRAGHARLQARAYAQLGVSLSGGRVMRGNCLEMASNQLAMGFKSTTVRYFQNNSV